MASLAFSITSAAAAQDDTARARALFHEGVELMDSGDHLAAVDRFRQTLELRRAPAVLYNLGLALNGARHYVEAAEVLREVVDDSSAPGDQRDGARALLADVEPRIGHLTVDLSGNAGGIRVTVDEETVSPADLSDVLVDPGAHVVVAHRGGDVVDTQRVDVAEGGDAAVTLFLGGAPSPRDAALSVADDEVPTDDDDAASGGVLGSWWFWTAIGVIVLGSIGAALVLSSEDDPQPVQGDFDPPIFNLHVMP